MSNILTSIQWLCSPALFIKRISIYDNIHAVHHHTRKSRIYYNINVYFATLQTVLWFDFKNYTLKFLVYQRQLTEIGIWIQQTHTNTHKVNVEGVGKKASELGGGE